MSVFTEEKTEVVTWFVRGKVSLLHLIKFLTLMYDYQSDHLSLMNIYAVEASDLGVYFLDGKIFLKKLCKVMTYNVGMLWQLLKYH